MTRVFLGLGSNRGNKEENIVRTVQLISKTNGVTLKKVSTVFQTASMYDSLQPDYFNLVLELDCELDLDILHQITKNIELKLGRKMKGDMSERTIDIDILFYGQELVCNSTLTVPHPLIDERLFVLEPLKEIAPDFVHPVLNQTAMELYENLMVLA